MLEINTEIVDYLDINKYEFRGNLGRPSKYGWKEKVEPLGIGQTLVLDFETPDEAERLIASFRGWLFQKNRNQGRTYKTRKMSDTKFGVWRVS